MQDRFPLLYFFHRFGINAVTKTLGGLEYSNPLSGDGQQASRRVSPVRQRAAMKLLLRALDPGELAIPDTVLTLFSPRLDGNVELFGTRTDPAFDELGAARTLSQMTVDGILQRERAARMVQYSLHYPNGGGFTLQEAIGSLVTGTWNGPAQPNARLAAIQRVTQRAVADRLLQLAADKDASQEVRAIADFEIVRLRAVATAKAVGAAGDDAKAHWRAIGTDFRGWIERGVLPSFTPPLRAPPGDPFGEVPFDLSSRRQR